jgi:hypothetical protein
VTDARGRFQFDSVAPGPYTFVLEFYWRNMPLQHGRGGRAMFVWTKRWMPH